MNKSKTTKDERMLLALSKIVKKNQSQCINVKELSITLGYSEKQAKQALHLLTRANFLLKHGEWEFELTDHGRLAAEHVE